MRGGRAGGAMPEHRLTVTQSLAKLPGPAGERFVELFQHGTLSVELYAPRGSDPQQPHTRDGVSVLGLGGGQYRTAESLRTCGAGDLLFVPAGVTHRFEDSTEDLADWVVFYGPEGGEVG